METKEGQYKGLLAWQAISEGHAWPKQVLWEFPFPMPVRVRFLGQGHRQDHWGWTLSIIAGEGSLGGESMC
jgi:hypothetical protein